MRVAATKGCPLDAAFVAKRRDRVLRKIEEGSPGASDLSGQLIARERLEGRSGVDLHVRGREAREQHR